ncbi:hypothetical protein [Bradyrhizobium sp. Tv2a-2]|uniref:hypothetical protein n=1 Tax=Bradyrhizobium sp. Tv2a-2 TaxID=113395 RepID=UPI00041F8A53|nr:hypothetical protein [Bradyrhizobium sp. Tv2a-2]
MLSFKLRYKILLSAVPLVAAATFAGVEVFDSPRPCIAVGAATLEIGSEPWHADLHVSFTDDPALATVRVALTDDAAGADFAVIDDVASNDDNACGTTPSTQFIAVSAEPTKAAPVIYLAQDGPADYRIFVNSKHFTPREAAALIVGARSAQPQLAAAL